MHAAVLFITGIYTAVGFNIYTTPVKNFSTEDPLFGQTIIKSSDGVFVPSPASGDAYTCTNQGCSKNVSGGGKGLSPIASVASSFNGNKEQLLVCNQVRTRNSSTEYFNGNCTWILDRQVKSNIYPEELVSQILKNKATTTNNNNNNNNKYQDSPHQDSWRKRRALEEDPNTDTDDDDEDAGTEIAFVLDGSGSINKEDFIIAKDFIYNVTQNVWETCFSCNFAIVQFGRNIRTELSLKENNDSSRALLKVKNITQLYEITKTASALYHVLTEVFVPEQGSNEKAKKMIILLSDGEMTGDNRTLSDVLNMKEMQGITRYSIGVGPDVLGKPKAEEQMITIAGSKDRYFNVSNYAALEEILSSLEKNIIGIEGLQKGAGFELQLAEAGFSSHITHDDSILFGAVGAYDWSGGIILKQNNEEPVTFFNATKEEPRYSYLGYSVASANRDSKTLYISGAPRYNLTGAVFIFNGINQDLLQGDQVGSYFGSVLCALDINNDKETDYLLVGAPLFHVKGEEGKVLIYKLNEGKFEKEATELRGLEAYSYARFGSAVADIGDIDGNGFSDVAVGAPLEEYNAGSVYIYNGFKDGIKNTFSQRITPSDVGCKLEYFGQAVSVMPSTKEDKQPLICVGSKGAINFFQTIPVIIIKPKITIKALSKEIKQITIDKQNNDGSSKFAAKLNICFNSPKGDIKSGELPIEYQIDLDWGKEQKRLVYVNPHEGRRRFTMTDSITCIQEIAVEYVGCSDCFSPIKIRVNFTLTPSTGIPIRVLDVYNPKEAIEEIQFEKDCSQNCMAAISLNSFKLSKDSIIIGETPEITFDGNLKNSGDSSYITTLTLIYPEVLSFKKSEHGTCENKNDKHQIVCKLLHPIFRKNAETSVTIVWQPMNRNTNSTALITALLSGGNNGSEQLDFKTYTFTVKKALNVQLAATAEPKSLNITEGDKSKKQKLHFTFKLRGENKYGAKINLTITIEKDAHKTDMIIENVEPKNCSWPSDAKSKSISQIVCTELTDLQEVNITVQTHIHDIEGSEKIIATAEITYDESIYHGKNIMKTYQVVSLIKLTVVKSTPLIVGSAIGGFLLLIVIIIILFKCGFFRRRRKMDRTPSTN
ncbi:integrin alpha-E [Clarias gariepinus]|uniref:integrin alpha-E n=1 Tax=Clarias gariepinus TaxID=13013 RepID=UPI00234E17A1|nr:integrin alpha-E [Clarias gariepinus]